MKGKGWKTRSHSEWVKRGGRGFLAEIEKEEPEEGRKLPASSQTFSLRLLGMRGAGPCSLGFSLPLGEFSPRSTACPLWLTPFSTLPLPQAGGPAGTARQGGRAAALWACLFLPSPLPGAATSPQHQRQRQGYWAGIAQPPCISNDAIILAEIRS